MSTILVVDDRPLNRQFLVTLLGYGGHRLLEASDGEAALAIARAEWPDLIITDIVMPGMDGVELTQRLRALPQERLARTPVIFYSATYREREARALAESCGVLHVLVKPVEARVLLETVKAALASAAPGQADSPPRPPKPSVPRDGSGNRLPAGGSNAGPLQLLTLLELSLTLGEEREPGVMLETFCRGAREIAGVRAVGVGLLADDGQQLAHFTTSDADGPGGFEPPPLDRGLFGRVLHERRPLYWEAAESGEPAHAPLPKGPRARSLLAAPVLLHGQPCGVLYFADKLDGGPFNGEDEWLAMTLSLQLAVAHERVRLQDEIQRHAVALRLEMTERRRAEETIRQSEARFRSLVLNSTDVINVIDAEGTLRYISPGAERVTGYPLHEQLGKSAFALVHPDDLPEVQRTFSELCQAPGATLSMQVRVRHADGSWRVMEAIGRNLLQDPAVRGLVVNSRDITERKQAEEERRRMLDELQRTNNTLRTLIDTLPAGVMLADSQGRLTLSNQFAQGILGGPPTGNAFGPSSRYALYRPDGSPFPGSELPLARALTDGERTWDTEILVRREDGVEITLLEAGSPVRDETGAIVGAVVVMQDITQHRRMEEELQKSDKLESIGVLAGGIAHDFNNVLAAVLANVSLAKLRTSEADEMHAWLNEAEKACRRARDLTQRLLTFAKGGHPVRKSMDLSELLRDSTTLALSGSNVRPQVEIPEDLWPADIDPGQIGQVIQNLVLNAQQAMPQGGTVRVRAENVVTADETASLIPGPFLRISVADHGPGIPADLLPKVFDPFFTTKPKGSGLGLATAYSVVKKHGGHISIESRPGLGTTFEVYLPAQAPGTAWHPAPAGLPGLDAVLGQGNILVMDDERSMRETVHEVLSALGYETTVARDGAEAVELYRKALEAGKAFDLAILDLTVPGGMGGQETLRQIQHFDPGVRALVSSGYSNDPVMADFRAHGFHGAVPKPFTVKELSEVVHAVISGQWAVSDGP